MKKKYVCGMIAFVMLFILLNTLTDKVYASTGQTTSFVAKYSTPDKVYDYYQIPNEVRIYPTTDKPYITIVKNGSNELSVIVSDIITKLKIIEQVVGGSTTYVARFGNYNGKLVTINLTIKTSTITAQQMFWNYSVGQAYLANMELNGALGVFTGYGDTITTDKINIENMNDVFLYTNHDILNNNNTDYVICVPRSITEDPEPNWSYEYDSSIPNVDGLTIQTHAWYRTNWGLVVGESKDKYEIKWTVPQGAGLILEIQVASKFNNVERRKFKQRYDYPWAEGYTVLPETGEMNMSLMQVGTWCLHNVWNDVDTGSWFNIPPTKLYFRYAVMDGNTKKVKYGNWSRMQFSGGSNGIIETRKDTITTSEQFDQTTGETVYTDTPVEGNETEYINRDGEIVDESQSFNAVVDTVGNAIDSSTSALNNVGVWLGQVPQLIGSLFTFLPPEIIAIIGLGIALIVILRIAGR